ncbi:MAG: hypothetical protein JZU58_21540 [Curvibacter lanceolatus]|uniref:hypothetical protein n=1 Tax=Curvibacter lanceolatus TaxID=86182 RepID=UPI002353CC20|nr:hypothetical protein [Curvibacter lanceolatus]MBV5294930.1 hypothetical protein [Curvibacter lanceolatus]
MQVAPYFSGTTNPRHLRALEALERGPVLREALDLLVGAANGPELVAELRRRGLEIPCQRVKLSDLDGLTTRGGRYYLTARDSEALARWRDDAKPRRVDSTPGAGLVRLLHLLGVV